MTLKLEVVHQGQILQSLTLAEGKLKLGRAPDSHVVLPDAQVSSRHAEATVEGEALKVVDLESTTGTHVGTSEIRSALLSPGQEFRIGPYVLRLVGGPPKAPASPPEDPVAPVQPIRELLALTDVMGISDVKVVLETLLSRTLELLAADRGFVVLVHEDQFSPLVAQLGGPGEDEAFSRTVCRQALASSKPVLLAGEQDFLQLGSPRSLVLGASSVVLAIPLRDNDQVLGVLYVEGGRSSRLTRSATTSLFAPICALGGRAIRAALDRKEIVDDRERWRWLATLSETQPDIFRSCRSLAMQRPLEIIRRVASEDVTALILGESGTGKEVAAETVHRLSRRAKGPFIAINCAAIPADLVESELFGHEAGAFTGAATRRPGRLELAQGGTLFLDEVGDLPQAVQVKLLRVLETRTFERIGGHGPIRWDARLLSATNRDLQAAAGRGDFRSDLYYRLNVVSLRLPALRERPDDIDAIAHELLLGCNRRFQRKLLGFTPEAVEALRSYNWPGNVRELKNAVERAFILETGDRIGKTSLGLPSETPLPTPATAEAPGAPIPTLEQFVADQERAFIAMVLDRVGNSMTQAASTLGLSRQGLHKKMKNLGMQR
jgi:DNA-binding NtrC family response regulator